MNSPYHRQILQRALGHRISSRALTAITHANLGQDDFNGLFFHPEYHFDSNLFVESLKFIEDQRQMAARADLPTQAWAAFGRLAHTAQDFYAHSNYVALWLENPRSNHIANAQNTNEKRELPPVTDIDALDPALLKHPQLITWSVAWLWEALAYIPPLRAFARRHAPHHSHAHENLDTPDTGPLFPYAIEAAVQRTVAEFDRTLALMGEENGEAAVRAFLDKG